MWRSGRRGSRLLGRRGFGSTMRECEGRLGMRGDRWHVVMAGVVYALLGVFLVWPIVSVVRAGFVGPSGFTGKYVGLVFSDPALVRGLVNAGGIAVAVT